MGHIGAMLSQAWIDHIDSELASFRWRSAIVMAVAASAVALMRRTMLFSRKLNHREIADKGSHAGDSAYRSRSQISQDDAIRWAVARVLDARQTTRAGDRASGRAPWG